MLLRSMTPPSTGRSKKEGFVNNEAHKTMRDTPKGRRRRPLASVEGDVNTCNSPKRPKTSGGQKRIESFFSTGDGTNGSGSPLKEPSSEPSSTAQQKATTSSKVGPKEMSDSSEFVSSRHRSLYGVDVNPWSGSVYLSSSYESSEPLHPWFENALDAYITPDIPDEEFKSSKEVNLKREEESWSNILSLLNNSLSPKHHLSVSSLHKLLLHGTAHKLSPMIRSQSALLVRKIINFFAVPDSKKNVSYYLKALAREEKGVEEFDNMEPWELLETILESLLEESTRYLDLFEVMVELIETEFELWSKQTTKGGSSSSYYPMLSTILCFFSGEPSLNLKAQTILRTYVSSLLLSPELPPAHLNPLRILVSILVQILGQRGGNEAKLSTVHFFSEVLREQESLFIGDEYQVRRLKREIFLLRPTWLSFCLSHSLIGHISKIREARGQVSLRSALETFVNSITEGPHLDGPGPRGSEGSSSSPYTPKKRASLKRRIHIAVDKRNAYGETPLHIACKRGNVERVQAILACPKVDVNARDHNGWTALHEACSHGRGACVRALLDYRPSNIKEFLQKGDGGKKGSSAVVSVRVDVLATAGENGLNPFHDCILSDNVDLVTLFMDKVCSDPEFPSIKALLGCTSGSGQSCLDLARSEEMKLTLQGFTERVSIPRRVVLDGAPFELIKFLLVNFMSKYVSYFGLHVQKEYINFLLKRGGGGGSSSSDRKALDRLSFWRNPPSNERRMINSGGGSLAYQRSRETGIRDIRSYCSLMSTLYASPEIQRVLQALK